MNFAMPVMEPCFFCAIAQAGDEWSVVARDELTITALNGRQHENGQCIVFPVRHAGTLLDLSREEAAAVMHAAQRIGAAMVRALSPEALLLYQNNGILSGQEVPHFHLHVVPRTPGSDWGTGPTHLARAASASRGAHLDHTVASAQKRATVATLKRTLDE
jgi:histidine triad (HIT) family protein